VLLSAPLQGEEKDSKTPLILIKLEGEPTGYAENPES
jgi:hypothetical protein